MRNNTPKHLDKASDIAERTNEQLGAQSIPALYLELVLANRSRQYRLDAEQRKGTVEIMHTLLGIELKIGRRRLVCPDLATARYLAVFARIGVDLIAVPYDISQLSRIADEFESSWHRTLLLTDHLTAGRTDRLRNKVRNIVVSQIREEIKKLGAGSEIPIFPQIIKRRRTPKPS